MEEKRQTSLPENAHRELQPGEEYRPIMSPEKNYPEVTLWSVAVGLLMTIIFSAAAAYLGLKVGQVFEAAIPIAILAVGLSSALGRKNSLGENVMIQSIGSCSGAIVAGLLTPRRHTRHPVPDTVQEIFRKGHAREIPFP